MRRKIDRRLVLDYWVDNEFAQAVVRSSKNIDREYTVVISINDKKVYCSCVGYRRTGMCKHIMTFLVVLYEDRRIDSIFLKEVCKECYKLVGGLSH